LFCCLISNNFHFLILSIKRYNLLPHFQISKTFIFYVSQSDFSIKSYEFLLCCLILIIFHFLCFSIWHLYQNLWPFCFIPWFEATFIIYVCQWDFSIKSYYGLLCLPNFKPLSFFMPLYQKLLLFASLPEFKQLAFFMCLKFYFCMKKYNSLLPCMISSKFHFLSLTISLIYLKL